MDLNRIKNESIPQYKERCLRAFIKYIEFHFPLRHKFEVLYSNDRINETHIPPNGSILCITEDNVFYYYVPYRDYGSPKFEKYPIKSIYDFIYNPLRSHVITPNAPYDLMDMDELPAKLKIIAGRLKELKQAEGQAARHGLDTLKGQDKNMSAPDMLKRFLEQVDGGDFSALDGYHSKSQEFADYASEVSPIAKEYLASKLSKLAQSDMSEKINNIAFSKGADG